VAEYRTRITNRETYTGDTSDNHSADFSAPTKDKHPSAMLVKVSKRFYAPVKRKKRDVAPARANILEV